MSGSRLFQRWLSQQLKTVYVGPLAARMMTETAAIGVAVKKLANTAFVRTNTCLLITMLNGQQTSVT